MAVVTTGSPTAAWPPHEAVDDQFRGLLLGDAVGHQVEALLVAEPGSYVHYVEGSTAPTYSSDSLHSAVVELIALPGARIRYTTVQNWSTNVHNLVTKRADRNADGPCATDRSVLQLLRACAQGWLRERFQRVLGAQRCLSEDHHAAQAGAQIEMRSATRADTYP
jgi:hypothetical protein